MKLIEALRLLHRAYKYKKNDKGEIAYLKSTIKKGDTVFDIGAHKAGYLYFILKQVGKQGKVVGFEPQTNLFNYLIKIKQLFDWKNVTIENLALSNTTGHSNLYFPTDAVGKSSSPSATILHHENDAAFTTIEQVSIATLDAYCTQNNLIPQFLKIDVEGNELNVFKGAATTLAKFKPKIIVEIEARHIGQEKVIETIKFLQSLGYQGKIIDGYNYIPLSQFTFEKYQNLNNKKGYCNNFIFE
ncbi:MAG: FkbM family methyltransferase [Chitinophagia bacterium]